MIIFLTKTRLIRVLDKYVENNKVTENIVSMECQPYAAKP